MLWPTLVLAVQRGIGLAMSENPGLDMMQIEQTLVKLFEFAPDREPEPERE